MKQNSRKLNYDLPEWRLCLLYSLFHPQDNPVILFSSCRTQGGQSLWGYEKDPSRKSQGKWLPHSPSLLHPRKHQELPVAGERQVAKRSLGVWHCDGLDEDVPIGSYIQMLVLGWWCCLGGGYGTFRRWRLAGRSVSLEVTLRFYSLVYFLFSLGFPFVGDMGFSTSGFCCYAFHTLPHWNSQPKPLFPSFDFGYAIVSQQQKSKELWVLCRWPSRS